MSAIVKVMLLHPDQMSIESAASYDAALKSLQKESIVNYRLLSLYLGGYTDIEICEKLFNSLDKLPVIQKRLQEAITYISNLIDYNDQHLLDRFSEMNLTEYQLEKVKRYLEKYGSDFSNHETTNYYIYFPYGR